VAFLVRSAVDEVTLEVEVVVKSGVVGCNLPQRLQVPKLQHGSFASSERQVAALRPIVESADQLAAVQIAKFTRRKIACSEENS
jgi:hypothetical protein